MTAQSQLFLCLKDNFGVLLHDPASGATASIDAPEAHPVEAALRQTGWRLTDILVTHHHQDHTGGIEELKARYRCRVVAPDAEVKVYLTADPQERARRRAAELGVDPATVLAEQAMRDRRDRTRADSPLVKGPDAVEVDTTGLSLSEVVQRVVDLIAAARP